jgi:hypothetical protein
VTSEATVEHWSSLVSSSRCLRHCALQTFAQHRFASSTRRKATTERERRCQMSITSSCSIAAGIAVFQRCAALFGAAFPIDGVGRRQPSSLSSASKSRKATSEGASTQWNTHRHKSSRWLKEETETKTRRGPKVLEESTQRERQREDRDRPRASKCPPAKRRRLATRLFTTALHSREPWLSAGQHPRRARPTSSARLSLVLSPPVHPFRLPCSAPSPSHSSLVG